jgi:hypothetical protein
VTAARPGPYTIQEGVAERSPIGATIIQLSKSRTNCNVAFDDISDFLQSLTMEASRWLLIESQVPERRCARPSERRSSSARSEFVAVEQQISTICVQKNHSLALASSIWSRIP